MGILTAWVELSVLLDKNEEGIIEHETDGMS